MSQNLTETLGFVDDVSKSSAVSRDLSDTVGLADDVSKSFAVSRTSADTVGLADSCIKVIRCESGPNRNSRLGRLMYQSHSL